MIGLVVYLACSLLTLVLLIFVLRRRQRRRRQAEAALMFLGCVQMLGVAHMMVSDPRVVKALGDDVTRALRFALDVDSPHVSSDENVEGR